MDAKKLLELTKQIREETGYGIMDIKKALEETEGDIAKTKAILTAKGLEAAAKRADRETHQGLVVSYLHFTGKMGAMLELLCETDFVAKNPEFAKLAKDLCSHLAAVGAESSTEMLEQDFVKDPTKKIKDMISELTGKLGENLKLGRIARFEI